MKAVLLVAVVGLAAAKPQPKELTLTEGRIIGGEEAPKHEFPWQVSLKSFGSHICGGSIVNKNQILTAAHCCQGQLAALDSIVAGAHDMIIGNNFSSPASFMVSSCPPTCFPLMNTLGTVRWPVFSSSAAWMSAPFAS